MNLLSALTDIGFTEYEAKVYLALLSEHPATGYQISKKSSVPRSMVYETLSRLHARGAVMETVEARSTLYSPLPPDVLLDNHQQTVNTLIDGLRDELDRIYENTETDHTWSVMGQETIYSYAREMIHKTQEYLYLVLTDGDVDALEESILEVCNNGIEVNALLTGERGLSCGNVLRHPPLESELQGLTGTFLIVSDRSEVLIASRSREMSATITQNANVVLIARQFVWMELFTQRIYRQLGDDFLDKLSPEDRQIFESLGD